jgi:hypothetical protein
MCGATGQQSASLMHKTGASLSQVHEQEVNRLPEKWVWETHVNFSSEPSLALIGLHLSLAARRGAMAKRHATGIFPSWMKYRFQYVAGG